MNTHHPLCHLYMYFEYAVHFLDFYEVVKGMADKAVGYRYANTVSSVEFSFNIEAKDVD